MDIFGVPIATYSHEAVRQRISLWLDESCFHRIATVNPEFLLEAERSLSFKKTLLAAELCIADGVGIVFAGLLHGEYIPRFPGADLMEAILRIAEQKQIPVYLAVRAGGLSSFHEIQRALLEKYPKLKIDGANISVIESVHANVQNLRSKIIFCNFGIPEQEVFLESLRQTPGNIRLAMGVGGAFDYLTGKQKRAPRWLRYIGLEWCWRLCQQPQRWRRIWNAVVIFPFRVFFARIQR